MTTKFDADTKVVHVFGPADIRGGAEFTDRVSLSNYDSAMFLYYAEVGTTGEDVTVQIRQHDDATAGNSKAVGTGQWYAVENATQANLGDALTAYGDGDGEMVNQGELNCLGRCEITSDMLDTAGGFKFVNLSLDNSGNTAGKSGVVLVVLRGALHKVAVDGQPTVLS